MSSDVVVDIVEDAVVVVTGGETTPHVRPRVSPIPGHLAGRKGVIKAGAQIASGKAQQGTMLAKHMPIRPSIERVELETRGSTATEKQWIQSFVPFLSCLTIPYHVSV